MKTFVIGDIHGRIEALKEVLKSSNFDYDNDKLIMLGDIVDGGKHTFEVVEELLKIKNRILVIGNHDLWFRASINDGWKEDVWIEQGGRNTLRSYKKNGWAFGTCPDTHKEFFNKFVDYYIQDNDIFVHGGFDDEQPLKNQNQLMFTWNREIIGVATQRNLIRNDNDKNGGVIHYWGRVFIGHTTTERFHNEASQVVFRNNLVMMDTGAGWNGRLSIMNIETQEIFQSKFQVAMR